MGGLRVFSLRRDYTADAGFSVYRVLYTVICPSVGHQCLLVETIAHPVLLKWVGARQRVQLTVSVRHLQCTPMPLKHKPDSHGVQIHVEFCLDSPLLGMRARPGKRQVLSWHRLSDLYCGDTQLPRFRFHMLEFRN
jgi:hypothetical protein